jgi:hypothetical protein
VRVRRSAKAFYGLLSAASLVAWLWGGGVALIVAFLAASLGAALELALWWYLLLVVGVCLVATSALVAVAERRRRELRHEESRQHFWFMTNMHGIRRRFGSNFRERRPVSIDWHADLVRHGESHLSFLERVAADDRRTTSPGYLDAKPQLVTWCDDLVRFASARGIAGVPFERFPEGWNWDDVNDVRRVIESNLATLKTVPPVTDLIELTGASGPDREPLANTG